MSETLSESLRRRLREHNPSCPTCGQPTGQSLRALGQATGVPFTVLARFLKGGDMMGRNLDLIDAFLALPTQASDSKEDSDDIADSDGRLAPRGLR